MKGLGVLAAVIGLTLMGISPVQAQTVKLKCDTTASVNMAAEGIRLQILEAVRVAAGVESTKGISVKVSLIRKSSIPSISLPVADLNSMIGDLAVTAEEIQAGAFERYGRINMALGASPRQEFFDNLADLNCSVTFQPKVTASYTKKITNGDGSQSRHTFKFKGTLNNSIVLEGIYKK